MPYKSTIPVVVREIYQETPLIKRFTLYPTEEERLPSFGGGSHITTYISTNEMVLHRPYSLCSDPGNTEYYQIAVRYQENSRGGSAYWHHHVREGFELEISYPQNHFPLSFRAKHHVFYAAGIGITPFIAMMADLQAKGASFELHYAAPSKQHCAFYEWIQSQFATRCHFYFSEEGNRMTPQTMFDQPIGTHVYFCGPPSMVRQYKEAAITYGYPSRSIHYELFSPSVDLSPEPFDVELQKSGGTLHVPQDQSLLDVLIQAGVKAPYSCRMGRCGTCAIEVLQGEIDHRDVLLSEEEKKAQNIILVCVSRSRSKKLVLNL